VTWGGNDYWVPGAASWTNHAALPGPVTPDTEAAEYAGWLDKLEANGVTIGPTFH
jgi:hypothetical protein